MTQQPFVADRSYVDTATELMGMFGKLAGFEAQARAHNSRRIGNAIDFCKWRSIERLIELLTDVPEGTTLH